MPDRENYDGNLLLCITALFLFIGKTHDCTKITICQITVYKFHQHVVGSRRSFFLKFVHQSTSKSTQNYTVIKDKRVWVLVTSWQSALCGSLGIETISIYYYKVERL